MVAARLAPDSVDEIDRVAGGDVLEHDLEAGQALHQRRQHAFDEARLAVEHVDLGVGDLAMDEKRHADGLHALQHRHDTRDIGHAHGRIGRGIGGVELGRGEHALLEALRDRVGVGASVR